MSDYDKSDDFKCKPISEVLDSMKDNSKGNSKYQLAFSHSMINFFGGNRVTRKIDKLVLPGGTSVIKVVNTEITR